MLWKREGLLNAHINLRASCVSFLWLTSCPSVAIFSHTLPSSTMLITFFKVSWKSHYLFHVTLGRRTLFTHVEEKTIYRLLHKALLPSRLICSFVGPVHSLLSIPWSSPISVDFSVLTITGDSIPQLLPLVYLTIRSSHFTRDRVYFSASWVRMMLNFHRRYRRTIDLAHMWVHHYACFRCFTIRWKFINWCDEWVLQNCVSKLPLWHSLALVCGHRWIIGVKRATEHAN